MKHLCAAFLLGGLASLAHANPTTIVGAVSVTPLDSTNPWCPGGLVQITAVIDDSSNQSEEGRFHIALADNTAWGGTCWTSLPNSIQGNIWHYACDGCGLGTTAAPLSGNNNNNYPNGGYKALAGFTGPGQVTKTFVIQLPSNLIYGRAYRLHFATNDYYLGVGAGAQDTDCFSFTACTPSGGSSFVGKRVEGTANNGEIMLYWLDYDFINSTGNKVRDTVPACMTIVAAQPQPINGLPASITGNTVQWQVADATSSSTPVAYREKGALWVLVSLSGCSGQVCNTGEFTSSFFSGGTSWQPTNDVCQNIGGVNVTLYKRQYDASYTPITSANDGQNINYVLNYTLSGSGLRCFDSFNSYATGTYNSSALPGLTGAKWSKDPNSPGTDQWNINALPTGERYIQYQCVSCGNYYILRYDCPTASLPGADADICGNVMIEADVRIDGNAANGDTGLVIRNNGRTTGSTSRGYMVILSIDSQGAGNVQNLQLQRNVDPFNSGTAWPGGGGYTAPAGQAPIQGVWYTIKVMEQPAGYFRIKYWERGTPEPAWQVTFDDSAYMNANQLACGASGASSGANNGDGWLWKPGIAGQADKMSYDNFRVYGAASLTDAYIWDTIPAGIDYQSTLNTPLYSTPSGTGANEGVIAWRFFNTFGAVGNILYEGSGSFTWVGKVDCSEAGVIDNTATIGAAGVTNQDSNTTSLTVSSCGTPTATRTRTPTVTPSSTATPTATPSATRTATPTATLTATPSMTRTATPSATPSATQTVTATATPSKTSTPSATPSSTQTVTLTATPTKTSTSTATPTHSPGPSATFTSTLTGTPTATPTYTMTVTFTATPTATNSNTRTGTPTATPSITVTVPFTSTNTPTASPTSSVTPSFTPSYTPTATPTATPSFTQSITFTHSPTLTGTPTATPTATQSVTFTESYTYTATLTASPTKTQTATRTMTMTFTHSPTITETPVPQPHHVRISAYNGAGELVRLIFEGSAQYKPGDFSMNHNVIPGGPQNGGVDISFPGYMYDPALGQITGVTWLADNNDGQAVSGGIYTIKVEVTDQFGQTTTLQKALQVVSVTPQNEIIIYNSAGEIVARPQLTPPPTGRAYTNIVLKSESYVPEYDPATGQPYAGSYMLFEAIDETGAKWPVTWDGKNELGLPVNSGSYTAELIYSASGTVAKSVVATKGFVVLRSMTPGDLSSVVAGPNPALRGADLQIRYTPSIGYHAVARLFNLAGELVNQCEDPNATGTMSIGTKGTAPGVYILKVENTSGSAVVSRAVRKIAIVR